MPDQPSERDLLLSSLTRSSVYVSLHPLMMGLQSFCVHTYWSTNDVFHRRRKLGPGSTLLDAYLVYYLKQIFSPLKPLIFLDVKMLFSRPYTMPDLNLFPLEKSSLCGVPKTLK